MKILFISTVHPSAPCPTTGTFNKVLLDAMRAEGHDVRALVPIGWTRAGWGRLRHTKDARFLRWWYLPAIAPGRMHRSLSRRIARDWVAQTDGWRPDIVLGYWVDPDGAAALDLAERLGVPGVLLVGGTDINELAGTASRGAAIRATLRRAAKVITIGTALRSKVIELGVPAERVQTFRRGVNLIQFHPGDRTAARDLLQLPAGIPILLWVGRMVPVKGLDTLIRGFAEIRSEVDPVLYLLGSGPLEPQIRAAAKRHGIGDRVRLVGPVKHAALGDWFRAADLVLLPSRSEGMPNVLLEALACGTPFLASAVGSVPELAESPTWLMPSGDPTALARGVEHLLAQPARVEQRSVDDRDAARQFIDVLIETVASFPRHARHPEY